MRLVIRSALGLVFGLLVLFAVSGGDEARAQCCAPPPPCCAPPAPPPCCTPPSPPPTPPTPCCTPPGHNINVPGVNVNVNASVIVNANVNAQVNAQAGSNAGSRAGTTVFFGGGGYAGGVMPGPVSVINGLNVQGGREKRRVAYEDRREKTVRVVIQAFCLDAKEVPHPASQVFPERDVENGYEGELYRCLAGTRMQYVVAEYLDRISFDGGKTVTCDKNQALYHTREGVIECRKQTPARDCNERSLLRRFGAGVKVLTIRTVETFTAYREEEVESSSASSSSMTLSGGVGGMVY
jgi:hypothetical protein